MVSLELETGEIALTLRLLLVRLAEQIVFDAADERRSRQEDLTGETMQDGITVSLPEGFGGGRDGNEVLRGIASRRGRIVDVDDDAEVGGESGDGVIRFDRHIDGGRVDGFDVCRRAGDVRVGGDGVVEELAGVVRGQKLLIGNDLFARRTCRRRKRGEDRDQRDQQGCDERRRIPGFPIHGRIPPVYGFLLETALSPNELGLHEKSHQM